MTSATDRRARGKQFLRALTLCLLALAASLGAARETRAQWATNGNNTTTTNNVGIGTTTPSQMFHVHSIGTWAGTRVTTAATGSTIHDGVHFGYDDAYGAYLWNREASPIILSTSNTERMRVDAAGNVGVGTAAPSVKLHVNGTTLSGISAGTAADYPHRSLIVTTRPINDGVADIGFDTNSTYRGALDFTGSTGNFQWWVNNGGGWSNPFTINGGGNVGVGTASPSNKLVVSDGAAWPANNNGSLLVEASNAVGSGLTLSATGPGGRNFLLVSTASSASPGGGTFGIFDTSAGLLASSYRLVVNSAGNVGIGTISPAHRLDVAGNVNASALCLGGDCRTAWSQVGGGGGGSSQWANSGSNIYFNSGNVGVGTAAPSVKLHVNGTALSGISPGTAADYSHRSLIVTTRPINDGVADIGFDTNSTYRGALDFTGSNGSLRWWINNGGGWSSPLTVTGDGNVGVGTMTPSPAYKLDVEGDMRVSGNIAAKYQDVAEWVPTTQKLAAGTVVMLDPDQANHVAASMTAYDTRVAGVVSARPGITLGEAGEGKTLVATTGRVKVRVDATRAPIRVGDLLVTSDVEGTAMKSVPVDLGGTQIHRPGTIIGKALEPLAGGKGEILVLLSLQ